MSSVLRDQRGFTLTELLMSMAILGLVMTAVLTLYTTGTTVGLAGENKAEAQQAARAAALMNEDLRLAGYGFPPSQSQITPPAPAANITAAIITAASPTAITFMADLMNVTTTLSGAANSGDVTLTVNNAAGGFAPGDTIFLINSDRAATLTVTGVNLANNTINVNTGVICPGIAPPCYPVGSQVGRPRLITYSWNAGTQTLSKNAGDGQGLQPLVTGVQAFTLTYFRTTDTQILPADLNANLANIRRIAITMTAQSAAAQNRGTFTINSAVRPRNL